MTNNGNIIPLSFRCEQQTLTFTGYQLPEVFEVHFAHDQKNGVATVVLGRNNAAHIPDEYHQSDNPVYGWVYLHPTASSGMTVCGFEITEKNKGAKDE